MAYVPPYGSNGAMYLRPLLFGSGARVGLQPADEYTFLIMVMPVGDYYKDGLAPIPALVIEDYDRAAPRGVGNVKVAGNYVADLLPNMEGKKKGFPIGEVRGAKRRQRGSKRRGYGNDVNTLLALYYYTLFSNSSLRSSPLLQACTWTPQPKPQSKNSAPPTSSASTKDRTNTSPQKAAPSSPASQTRA